MGRQLALHARDDRVMEELRLLSPLMNMYEKWCAEDLQDAQDRFNGLDVPVTTVKAPGMYVLNYRFSQALQARQDAQDAEVVN